LTPTVDSAAAGQTAVGGADHQRSHVRRLDRRRTSSATRTAVASETLGRDASGVRAAQARAKRPAISRSLTACHADRWASRALAAAFAGAGLATCARLLARLVAGAWLRTHVAPTLGAFAAIGRCVASLQPIRIAARRAGRLAACADEQHEEHDPESNARAHTKLAFHRLTRFLPHFDRNRT
jgi:hypothetical protein